MCFQQHAATSPCGESKHALFVSIICLSITWGPASSPACRAREAGSRGWGQSGAPSSACHQEEPASPTRSGRGGTVCLPLQTLAASAFPPSTSTLTGLDISVCGPCMTLQTGMRNRQWQKHAILIRGLLCWPGELECCKIRKRVVASDYLWSKLTFWDYENDTEKTEKFIPLI